MITNKYPGIGYKNQGRDFNFFKKLDVVTTTFGGDSVDGYQPDVAITFPIEGLIFSTEGTTGNVVEYSFNGSTVHGELIPGGGRATLSFPSRQVSLIWFRVKAGSTGPITISVEASEFAFNIFSSGSSTPSFDPLSFSPYLWLRADRGVTLDGSNRVSLWEDQSGNENHFHQPNSGIRPELISSEELFNGNAGILFDNSNTGIAAAAIESIDPVTYGTFEAYIVLVKNSVGSIAGPRVYVKLGAVQYASVYLIDAINGLISDGIGPDYKGAADLTTEQFLTATVIGHRWSGTSASHIISKNGADYAMTDVVTYDADTSETSAKIYLCTYSGNQEWLNCKIAEFLIFPPLTDEQRSQLFTDYLNTRYSIA